MRSKPARSRMELRHLRCFVAVAEELHFARAAERMHMEQSPLSRVIRELEDDLGVALFVRSTRSTVLSHAGQRFLQHMPRVFAALEAARASVGVAARGFSDPLRIVLSESRARFQLPTLLARSRQENPDIDYRLVHASVPEQVQGLREARFDVGFALTNDVDEGIDAQPLWSEPLVLALPINHPLARFRRVPLEELQHYPLVLWDAEACEGHARIADRVIGRFDREPLVIDRVASGESMATLVAAGLGLGLASASCLTGQDAGVVTRRLATKSPSCITYLLRRHDDSREALDGFVKHALALGAPAGS